MIKASEIRIGNIYRRKHGKGWTDTVIDEKMMGKIFWDDDHEYALNDFEPIPISYDNLLEIGFLEFKWRGDSLSYDMACQLDLDYVEGKLLIKSRYEPESSYREVFGKKYIHQVQNMIKSFNLNEDA